MQDIRALNRILPWSHRTFRLLDESLKSRMTGPLAPNEEIFVSIPRQLTDRQILILWVSSFYSGEKYSSEFLLREVLLQKAKTRSPELRMKLSVLTTKAAVMDFLYNTLSERDFYGNFLPELKRLLTQIRIASRQQPRARRKVFRRGYRDHGTLLPDHRRGRNIPDTQEQLRIEEQRKIEQDAADFWRGFLE